jgi:colanic acid biosynthesis glycosyl transferase WcaI
MRILYVAPVFDPEPAYSRGLPLARALQNAGHEIEVVAAFPNYPGGRIYSGYRIRAAQREFREGIPILRVPIFPSQDHSIVRRVLTYGSFAVTSAIASVARGGNVDVACVWQHAAPHGLAGVALNALRRVPFVYDVPDLWPDSVIESGMLTSGLATGAAHRMISAWCNFVYRQAAEITVITPGYRRLLIERGVSPSKIHVLYSWTDETIFRPKDRNAARAAQLGIDRTFNVLHAGNMGRFQNVENLIRAACLLKDAPDVRLILIGTGQAEAEMRRLRSELAADNVIFMERQPDDRIAEILALMDVCVIHLKDCPFSTVSIPGKTQSILACGRPILVAARGDTADVVSQAGAGIMCEPESPSSIAAAILRMREMSLERREEMGRSGRQFYLREMSQAVGTKQMNEVLLRAAQSKRNRVAPEVDQAVYRHAGSPRP